MEINSIIRLPVEDSGPQINAVRMHNMHIDSKKTDHTRFFRREAVLIQNPENGNKVIRYIMGNPGSLSIRKDSVAIDYDAADALGVSFKQPVTLMMRRANLWEVIQWLWNHQDYAVQLSTKLGLVGAVLGVAGLLLSLFSLI